VLELSGIRDHCRIAQSSMIAGKRMRKRFVVSANSSRTASIVTPQAFEQGAIGDGWIWVC
jgi:hypothetical protein